MNKLMLSCVLLLLLTNVVVLSGVAYNRSAEPLASIELTERELPMQYSYSGEDENSATAVSLTWHVLHKDEGSQYVSNRYNTPVWLDSEKLTELGFDLEKLNANKDRYRYNREQLNTEVVLVMEYQGESYQQALLWAEANVKELRNQALVSPTDTKLMTRLKRSEERLTKLKVSQTRLYVIDAGFNEQALAQKYNVKNKYLFMRGEIGVSWNKNAIEGRVQQVFINDIHVPLPYSQLLTSLIKGEKHYSYKKKPIVPRYKIQLNIGKRLEPWIERIEAGN